IDVPVSLASWHILQRKRIKINVPVSLTNYSCFLAHTKGFDFVEKLAGHRLKPQSSRFHTGLEVFESHVQRALTVCVVLLNRFISTTYSCWDLNT
ncbi:hypothetical protein Tco_0510062, partial [Tanacetum coccineum]